MKVIEHLAKADHPLISFEIIPPLRGGDVRGLLALIEDLSQYKPPFIDITSHAAEVIYEETPQGAIQRRVKRKRPGTLGVCALIQNKYHIDAVPHILCRGFSREETEDFLIELKYLGIDNVLAVRGDDSGYQKPLQHGRSANGYACDLVAQISAMNQGKYLEQGLLDAEPSSFCVGVGGYPEKHFEAPNLVSDIRSVKEKVASGAEYVVTQMFFDNRHYFRYVEQCREAGITVPIIPGLKVITRRNQLSNIPRNFYVEIPAALADEVAAARDDEILHVGVEWALQQTQELLDRGVPSVHFYVMQTANAIKLLMSKLGVGVGV
ncbi:MAG TPA: methylenetetrahydrofolate reductase [Thermoanaerobaculia bacterium]|nr:methylenetetrahydrofolate reductase [Thermoanaerobaculia bacterium]